MSNIDTLEFLLSISWFLFTLNWWLRSQTLSLLKMNWLLLVTLNWLLVTLNWLLVTLSWLLVTLNLLSLDLNRLLTLCRLSLSLNWLVTLNWQRPGLLTLDRYLITCIKTQNQQTTMKGTSTMSRTSSFLPKLSATPRNRSEDCKELRAKERCKPKSIFNRRGDINNQQLQGHLAHRV